MSMALTLEELLVGKLLSDEVELKRFRQRLGLKFGLTKEESNGVLKDLEHRGKIEVERTRLRSMVRRPV
jgi:hypothetical protein